MAIRPSYAQMEKMIEFMEENPQLAKGRMRCSLGRYETRLKWQMITDVLNDMDGTKKTARQWSRFWADKKYSLKRRQVAQRNAAAYRQRYGLEDESPPLSNLDARIQLLIAGKKYDLSKKKKGTIKGEEIAEEMKPSTLRARPTRASNLMLRRCPSVRVRNIRSRVGMERLIGIEENRVNAETLQALGWFKAMKSLKHLARAVVQCGQFIANAIINRDM